ncbi:MAG: hypothetical protein LBL47_03980 [Lactobacillus sp.]|jgi:hypothetical protein|nr:hypothetical protein [Lactobacillus sp.]
MKKFFNIILCLSIIIASFDIIDTSDITIDGKAVFHSENLPDNHDSDSIEIESISLLSPLVLHINTSDTGSIELPAKNNRCEFVYIADAVYNNFTMSLYRPPIV